MSEQIPHDVQSEFLRMMYLPMVLRNREGIVEASGNLKLSPLFFIECSVIDRFINYLKIEPKTSCSKSSNHMDLPISPLSRRASRIPMAPNISSI